MKGWLIGGAIAVAVIGGIYELNMFAEHHVEADSDCYDLANQVASDPRVQLAMSDGYLTTYECVYTVKPIQDAARRKKYANDFIAYARASDNGSGQ